MTLLGRKAIREIRLKWRSFLAVAALVALACALMVGFTSALSDIESSAQETYRRLKFLDLYCSVEGLPRSVVERVSRLPEVSAVQLRYSLSGRILADRFGRDYKARIISVLPRQEPLMNRLVIHQGSGLYANRGELLLERRFAEAHDLQVGERVTLRRAEQTLHFRVVGLVSSPEYLWLTDNPLDPRPVKGRLAVVFASPADLRSLTGGQPENQLQVLLNAGVDRVHGCRQVAQALGGWSLEPPVPRELQPSYRALARDLRAFALLGTLFPMFFLCFGAAALLSALWQLVYQQQRQIGILLSQGVPRGAVMRHYCSVGIGVGGSGALLGVLLGLGLGRVLLHLYVGVLGLPFVRAGFHPAWLLLALVGGITVSGLAAWLAASSILRLSPVAALSGQTLAGPRTPAWLGRLSYGWRIAVRSLLRHPWRSLTALLGGVLAVILVTMVLVLIDSQKATLEFFFSRVHRYDLEVSFKGSPSLAGIAPIEDWEGVLEVQPVLRTSGRFHSGHASVWGLPPDSPLLRLYDTNLERVRLAPSEARLGTVSARRLKVSRGDPVGLAVFTNTFEWLTRRFYVGELLYEPLAFPVKVPLSDLQRQLVKAEGGAVDQISKLLVRTEPQERETLVRRLAARPEVSGVEVKSEQRRDIEEYLKLFDSLKLAMLIFAGSLGFMLMTATTTLNVMERRRELATMLCLGVGRSTLVGWLARELFCVWLVSLLLGAPLGVAAGELLVNSYESELLELRMYTSWQTLWQVAAASLVLVMGSGARAARLIFRLPLVEAVARAQ